MPRVIVTAGAVAGIERCRRFLAAKNPRAADRAAQAIAKQFLILETHPNIGRPDLDQPDFRELLIPFGDSGYVALYTQAEDRDTVYVLAFRHQKEAGY